MWQKYATNRLPAEQFMPLLDWNVKPWLDDGTGGGLTGDGSSMGGGFTGDGFVAGLGVDEKADKKQKRKDELEARGRPCTHD